MVISNAKQGTATQSKVTLSRKTQQSKVTQKSSKAKQSKAAPVTLLNIGVISNAKQGTATQSKVPLSSKTQQSKVTQSQRKAAPVTLLNIGVISTAKQGTATQSKVPLSSKTGARFDPPRTPGSQGHAGQRAARGVCPPAPPSCGALDCRPRSGRRVGQPCKGCLITHAPKVPFFIQYWGGGAASLLSGGARCQFRCGRVDLILAPTQRTNDVTRRQCARWARNDNAPTTSSECILYSILGRGG